MIGSGQGVGKGWGLVIRTRVTGYSVKVQSQLNLIIKERKGFPAEIFDWSRAEVSAKREF